jgi:hypothetical protein
MGRRWDASHHEGRPQPTGQPLDGDLTQMRHGKGVAGARIPVSGQHLAMIRDEFLNRHQRLPDDLSPEGICSFQESFLLIDSYRLKVASTAVRTRIAHGLRISA